MARIVGINLPGQKRIEIGLTEIAGIGRSTARKVLTKLRIDASIRVKDLSETDINKIRDEMSKYTLEGDLRRKVAMDIKRLQEIGSYRGFRHKRGLPVHGQRTRKNCRTRKGKKKTVANKKAVVK